MPVLSEHHLLANNAYAVEAAAKFATNLGYQVQVLAPESPHTTAEEVAEELLDRLSNVDTQQRQCVIWGGEPTVRLTEADLVGKGGRNQQLILKAITSWDKLSPATAERACVLSGGTDGEDGPTDAAGAFVTQSVVDQVAIAGLNASDHLQRNDAYPLLQRIHGLIKTGPTHTNVCDLRVATIG